MSVISSRRRIATRAALFVALAGSASWASGQQVVVQGVPAARAVVPGGVPTPAPNVVNPTPAAVAAQANPGADAAQQARAARLEQIKQLTFDRRPSETLRLWLEASRPDLVQTPSQAAPTARPPDPNKEPTPEETAAAQRAAADKAFADLLETLQTQVTLGHWGQVRKSLQAFEADEARAVYLRMLESLLAGPMLGESQLDPGLMQQILLQRGADAPTMIAQLAAAGMGRGGQVIEPNAFSAEDFVGLIVCRPTYLEATQLAQLGGILRLSVLRGHDVQEVLRRLRPIGLVVGQEPLTRRETALVLAAASEELLLGDYLPSLDEAMAQDDRQALNLMSRYLLARHRQEPKAEHLEAAWKVVLAALAASGGDASTKQETLRRAVELAPQLRGEIGQAWLDQSFVDELQRGQEILATIGRLTAVSLQARGHDPDHRLGLLRLQRTAVDSLLKTAPETADRWSEALHALAGNWLREAELSRDRDQSTSRGPRMQRDVYGNYYFLDEDGGMMMRQPMMDPRQALPIPTGKVLDERPSAAWLQRIPESHRPRFASVLAELHLKVQEEDEAFPHIERLASTHAESAQQLADEFLRVWIRNHDPNEQQRRTNPYAYFYGFDARAQGIPLTRLKQERNLQELGAWVARLRSLPISKLDDELLAQAFTTSHSSAEVFRLESIEKVFGPLDKLEPATLAKLCQTMRGNLAGVWQMPDVQKNAKTNRKKKDLEAEVLRGFATAREVVERALAGGADDWRLLLALASIDHDENEYRNELEKRSEYAAKRRAAFDQFARAADRYVAQSSFLEIDEETPEAFELWYYASLGSVDLNRVAAEDVPDASQAARIRAALDTLPEAPRKRHLERMANNLVTRLSNVGPAVKYRYLQGGFELVGDHPQAREARKVYDYYRDVVSEIKLEARIDGNERVGHGQPFGVFVDLRHTKEIERESGGFKKYFQNQNQQGYYYYNYGRPLENYRDKFAEFTRTALAESFEVVSITFNDAEAGSKALPDYGWRVTPYAYLLLKAKGPHVDKLPPLRIDLDFMDTSGFVILPLESAALALDARGESGDPRPLGKVEIVQTLDERQAADGKLIVEVKVTSRGLAPSLEQLLDIKPDGFAADRLDEQPLVVTQFEADSGPTAILAERTAQIVLRPSVEAASLPKTFRFPAPKQEGFTLVHQRYVDADLLPVAAEVSLEQRYGRPSYAWLAALAAATAAAAAAAWSLRRAWRRRHAPAKPRFDLPAELTPFTVLSLLRSIDDRNGLDAQARDELRRQIARLERHYFDAPDGDDPDLAAVATQWVSRAR